MLLILPLFLLLFLAVALGSIPGLFLHSLFWRRAPVDQEHSKLAHDVSLLICGAMSAALAFAYGFPLFAGIGDQSCPLGPVYC
jgi:hypothetical protein